MSLSDIVSVTITTVSTVLARAGFGVPLILSPNLTAAARTVECASLAEVLAASGMSSTKPEYLLAQAIFSQAHKPTKVILGRLANKPTLTWTIKVPTLPSSGVADSTVYTFLVTAPGSTTEQTVSITSDGTATNAEIIDALKTAFDLLSISGVTSSTSGSGDARVLILTADATGTIFGVRIPAAMRAFLWCTPNVADAGLAADLTAIRAENDTWYALLCPWGVGAYGIAIATAIEAITDSNKIAMLLTNDTEIIQTAGGSGMAGSLEASNRERTAIFYNDDIQDYLNGAVAGLLLPTDPGTETWAFKSVSGPSVDSLTPSQVSAALSYSVNIYTSIAGVAVTQFGTVSSGEYIDVVRGRDWLKTRLAEDVFALLASVQKVPFTDGGIALVETAIRGVLQEGVSVGLLSSNPAPDVSVPRASAVSSTNKGLRILPDVTFTATLAGAIHKTTIDGTISL